MPPKIRAYRALPRFRKAFQKLPAEKQQEVEATLRDLIQPTIPNSRGVKRLQGTRKNEGEIWEARLDRKFRLTFRMDEDIAVLRNVGPHEILSDP